MSVVLRRCALLVTEALHGVWSPRERLPFKVLRWYLRLRRPLT